MKRPIWLNKNVLGLGFASFLSDSSHEIVPLLLPSFIVSLVGAQYAPQYLGLITGVSTAAASFFVLVSGWLSDRMVNRKPLLVLGYALMGTCVALVSFAHHWFAVFILITLAWIGRGIIRAPRDSLIADSVPSAYYGHAFGFRQAMDTVGAVVGPLTVYLLAGIPLSYIFLGSIIPAILVIVTIIFFIHDLPGRIIQTKEIFNFASLPKSFYYFLGILFVFGLGNFNRTLLLLRIQNGLEPMAGHVAAISFVTLLYIFRNIIQVGSSYTVGALSDKIGRTLPLALLGFAAFGLMSFALMYNSQNLLFLLCIFFLSGLSAGVYTSLQKSFAADLLPESARGTGYGLLQTTESLAELICSPLVGFLWSAFSPETGFIYSAVMSIIAACLLMLFNFSQKPLPRFDK